MVDVESSDVFKPGVRLDYRWRDDIDGEDASLRVPIPGFPYPAPVTNPNTFGGEQLDLTLFARLAVCRGLVRRGGLFTAALS
jgi:hypothetical protein